MKTVRVLLPYGAHVSYDGVSMVHTFSDYITFAYQPKDSQIGNPRKGIASATFFKGVICGWSEEDSE
jgi:hypothetical protein